MPWDSYRTICRQNMIVTTADPNLSLLTQMFRSFRRSGPPDASFCQLFGDEAREKANKKIQAAKDANHDCQGVQQIEPTAITVCTIFRLTFVIESTKINFDRQLIEHKSIEKIFYRRVHCGLLVIVRAQRAHRRHR